MDSKATPNIRSKAPRPEETAIERRARLASNAIMRGHDHTLRRHLSEGLDPESRFYSSHSGFFDQRMIGEAAWGGAVECVQALEDAGARLTDEEILRGLSPSHNKRMVAYLLTTGKFDPAGSMSSGRPWADAISQLAPEPSRNVVQAISEWERSQLSSDAKPMPAKARVKSL